MDNTSVIKTERTSHQADSRMTKRIENSVDRKDIVKVKDESIYRADSIDTSNHQASHSHGEPQVISNPPENCINIENNPVFKKREQAEIQGLNQGSSSANKVSNNSRYEFAMTLSEFSPDKTRKGAHGWAQPHDHMLVKGVGNQTLGDEGEKYTSLFCTSKMKSFFQSHTMKFNKNM